MLAVALAAFALGVEWRDAALRPGTRAWVGPLAVVVIVVAMAVFTALAFESMRSLPLAVGGDAGHGH